MPLLLLVESKVVFRIFELDWDILRLNENTDVFIDGGSFPKGERKQEHIKGFQMGVFRAKH